MASYRRGIFSPSTYGRLLGSPRAAGGPTESTNDHALICERRAPIRTRWQAMALEGQGRRRGDHQHGGGGLTFRETKRHLVIDAEEIFDEPAGALPRRRHEDEKAVSSRLTTGHQEHDHQQRPAEQGRTARACGPPSLLRTCGDGVSASVQGASGSEAAVADDGLDISKRMLPGACRWRASNGSVEWVSPPSSCGPAEVVRADLDRRKPCLEKTGLDRSGIDGVVDVAVVE
jgi:hypothetical protein